VRADPIKAFLRYATRCARTSKLHGPDHWRRVAENGAKLAAETPGADPWVVAIFAAIHDTQRLTDRYDPDHGPRAAMLARRLHEAGELEATEGQLELLVKACAGHTRGRTTGDPTVGCCWDADRLDLPRCGIEPDPRLLSTEAGKRLAREG
jgi:uncharacterized protein